MDGPARMSTVDQARGNASYGPDEIEFAAGLGVYHFQAYSVTRIDEIKREVQTIGRFLIDVPRVDGACLSKDRVFQYSARLWDLDSQGIPFNQLRSTDCKIATVPDHDLAGSDTLHDGSGVTNLNFIWECGSCPPTSVT